MRSRLLTMCVLPWLTVVALAQAYSYRCWFDNSPSNAVSNTATGETSFNVDVSQLSAGFHALHVEAWNNNGRSSVQTRYFIKGDTPKATKARYWFDSDPSTMHDNVAASGTIDLEVLSLSVGLHTVHYQTFTADGMASAVHTRFFLIGQPDKRQLTSRVWIDNDTENAVTQQLTDEPILLNLNGLTGEHLLHIELYDAAGLLVGEQAKTFVADDENSTDPSGDEGEITTPKLVVTNLEVVGEGIVGADLTVKALINNEGTDFSGNVAYFASLDPNSVGRKQSTIIANIASGEENKYFAWGFIPDEAGTYYISVGTVDDSGQLLEVIGRTTFEVNDISGNKSSFLAVADANGLVGNTFTLPVSMTNEDEITAMQFELSLPDGVSVAGATLTDRKNGHSIDYSQLANGNYPIIVFSSSSKAVNGNEGDVVNISLNISSSMAAGSYTIQLKNIELTTTAGDAINQADLSATLTVSNIKLGDVNGDGKITITDAVGIVNHILGNASSNFHPEAADVNGDGGISITDAVRVVNIILNQGAGVKERRTKEVETEREPQ